jgi:hypothetical protein
VAKKTKKPIARKAAPAKAKGASATAVGRCLDLSRQRVGQLEAEGVFARISGTSRFDLGACTIAYIRWLRDENRRGSKAAGASVFQIARTKEIEQRIAREDGRLLLIESVDAAIDQIVGSFRAELAGVAAASTRDLDQRQAIEGHLNAAIERCREGLEGARADLQAGREVFVDSEEADT